MAIGKGGPLKVFCSYRSSDAAVVEAFATRLREAGLEAWFDRWEILPGFDAVSYFRCVSSGSHTFVFSQTIAHLTR